jgi:polygalacturonase
MKIFATMVRCAALAFAFARVGGNKADADPAPGLQDVSPAQPDIPAKVFNFDDFGGQSDGIASNTDAFRRAITSVEGAGGGTLIVRAGIYVTGAFSLCSRINLHLNAGALILFSPSEVQMENAGVYPALLMARNAHDIVISGAGTIFGSGEAWWPRVRESKRNRTAEPRRPDLVYFDSCQRIRVEGVTLTHAPAYNLVPFRCTDVTINGVAIYNPADDNPETDGVEPAQVRKQLLKEYADDSPNTDGIDPVFCQRLLISHCTIDTGDDGIAISSGGSETGLSRGILVTDCTFLHGHGCSIGSETRGEIRDVTVRRCVFEGTKVGIHLKSARGRGGSVNNIVCSDLTMNHVGEAILISSYYPLVDISIYFRPYLKKSSIDLANGGPDGAQPVTAETPHWDNITLRNISATCTWDAGLIQGLPEAPADTIVLDHVSIEAPEGLHINYAQHIVIHDVDIKARHGRSLIPGAGVDGMTQ